LVPVVVTEELSQGRATTLCLQRKVRRARWIRLAVYNSYEWYPIRACSVMESVAL